MKRFALAILLALAAVTTSHAAGNTERAGGLLMPFDATADHTSFFIVTTRPETDERPSSPVVTRWVFWDGETCESIAQIFVCMRAFDTVVVDPSLLQSLDLDDERVGASTSVVGRRGFVTVTAFAPPSTSATSCKPALPPEPLSIVGRTLSGSFTIANTATNAAYGGSAIAFASSGGTEPYLTMLHREAVEVESSIALYRPESLEMSELILVAVAERTGLSSAEIGPLPAPYRARSVPTFVDRLGAPSSLPDVALGCTLFTTVLPGRGLLPLSAVGFSSGYISFDSWWHAAAEDETDSYPGVARVFGFHGQAVGPYGTMTRSTHAFRGSAKNP